MDFAGLERKLITAKPGEVIYLSRKEWNYMQDQANDAVNHPKHYTTHPSGVECIQVTEHMNFNLGNAMKYIWRAGEKGDRLIDLQKAAWYLNREIERITKYHAK